MWEAPKPPKLVDNTPFEIKSHPEYKKLTDRFLGDLFKDKALEKWNAGVKAANIDTDMVNEDKEWEGYYPNELDQEMKGFKYGERLYPQWYNWTGAWGYHDYYNNQGNFAPPYDPHGNFESPYYHYNRDWWKDYWGRGYKGYWGISGYDNYSRRWSAFVQKELGLNSTDKIPPPPPPPPAFIQAMMANNTNGTAAQTSEEGADSSTQEPSNLTGQYPTFSSDYFPNMTALYGSASPMMMSQTGN